jgi:hypothetical protein
MSQAEGGDTFELGIVEVERDVLGGRAVNGPVASATGGEEAGLLFRRHVEPKGFWLQVVEDFCEATLKGLKFKREGLLEVEEGAGGLASAGMPESSDPNVGSVEVSQEISGLVCVDGRERLGRGEAAVL